MSESLFKFNDVSGDVARVKVESFVSSDNVNSQEILVSDIKDEVKDLLKLPLAPNTLYSCLSNGLWDHYHLVDHLLNQTGKHSELFLATWSISELSARKILEWVNTDRISKVNGVLDYRSKNRHPAAFHLAKDLFSDIKIDYCHAKVTVLRSLDRKHNITICGSANWTQNPRKEACMILNSEKTAGSHIKWIMEVVTKGEYGLD